MKALKHMIGVVAVLLGFSGSEAGAEDRAGDFDYYVLALSWQPSWCEREGDERGAASCRKGSGAGFTLHGLWPQHEDGWPEFCRTRERDATRSETAAMADIMGSPGLAWHQWKKHGRCSGLSARNYFRLSRLAYEAVVRPSVLRQLDETIQVDPFVIEDAFLEANPGLTEASTVVTCREGYVAEVRLCLTRDGLEPRRCTGTAARACRRPATLPPLR